MCICVHAFLGGGGALHKCGRRPGRVLLLHAFVYRRALNALGQSKLSPDKEGGGSVLTLEGLQSMMQREHTVDAHRNQSMKVFSSLLQGLCYTAYSFVIQT